MTDGFYSGVRSFILKTPWKQQQQQKDVRSQNISHGPAVIVRP